MKQYGFPKSCHLRTGREFARVYDQKQKAGDEHLLVFAALNDLEQTRIGLSVSRKQGNAVRRSRIKRLLREAFRLSRPDLRGGLDLILIPRIGSEPGLDEFRRSLVKLTKKLSTRLERRQNADGDSA